MRFSFNEKKATQASVRLLMKHGGRMTYLKLLKLLYLADRKAFLESERPITGDFYVSMDQGPVLSKVYNLISEEIAYNASEHWQRFISTPENWHVRLLQEDRELGDLSDFEIRMLDQVHAEFGEIPRFDLAQMTHVICPEWKDPKGSSIPIDPAEILRAENRSEAEIQRIGSELEDLRFIDFALSSCAPCVS